AIQELTPVYKTVFNLYVMEGYSHKEIAEELNINEGTSKSNLAKAKRNLRDLLENKNAQQNG
ncbi:MAG: RNA polymerase subunit sigma-70, partial [Flavobacteriales bacterium]|nr:RNA polymerase subunit sigma-70 [Flavobacteriales bacterium]